MTSLILLSRCFTNGLPSSLGYIFLEISPKITSCRSSCHQPSCFHPFLFSSDVVFWSESFFFFFLYLFKDSIVSISISGQPTLNSFRGSQHPVFFFKVIFNRSEWNWYSSKCEKIYRNKFAYIWNSHNRN